MIKLEEDEEMGELHQKALQQISRMDGGLHHCGRSNFLGIPIGFSKGWVEIEKKENPLGKGGYWSLMWTSHKNYHQPLNDNALWVQFYPEEIGIIGKTHITLHKVHDEEEKKRVVRSLTNKLDQAYNYNN